MALATGMFVHVSTPFPRQLERLYKVIYIRLKLAHPLAPSRVRVLGLGLGVRLHVLPEWPRGVGKGVALSFGAA